MCQRSTYFTHAVEAGLHIISLFYLRLEQTGEPRASPRPLNLLTMVRALCTERATLIFRVGHEKDISSWYTSISICSKMTIS
jgi:hypothetical protein